MMTEAPSNPTIDTLLRLAAAPQGPSAVLTTLATHPNLASAADSNGYTLLHAAASYSALDLLRALVSTYNVSVNIPDEDGDTPLFFAEEVRTAKYLIEELGADWRVQNSEGKGVVENARENLELGDAGNVGNERGWREVLRYYEELEGGASTAVNGTAAREGGGTKPLELPAGMSMDVRAVDAAEMEAAEEADPEFRRRIEELARREDFGEEAGQEELRRLVRDAVGGLDRREEREGRRRVEE